MTVFRPRAGEPPNPEAVEVSVSFWGSYEEWEMWCDIAAGFQAKNPGIWIKLNYIPNSYNSKIRLLLAADNAPDVMVIQDEPFPVYAAYGKFADLTDWAYSLESGVDWDTAFWPTAVESFVHQGRVMGAPIWGGNILVIYNRKMFRDFGVEFPNDNWTFDDFVSNAEALTRDLDGDGHIDTFGLSLPHWIYFLPWTWGFGANYLDERRTDWTFTGPEALAATTFYHNLRYGLGVSPSIQDMPGSAVEAMFMTNRIAMTAGGPWSSLGFRTAGIEFDIVHIPVGPAGERFTRVTWDALCLFEKSPHKAEALRFMAYCISPEAQAIVGRYVRSVPALIAAKDDFMDPDNGWNEEKYIEALEYARMQPISAKWVEMEQIMNSEYEQLLLNKQTPEQTIRRMAEAMRREGVFPIEAAP